MLELELEHWILVTVCCWRRAAISALRFPRVAWRACTSPTDKLAGAVGSETRAVEAPSTVAGTGGQVDRATGSPWERPDGRAKRVAHGKTRTGERTRHMEKTWSGFEEQPADKAAEGFAC